VTFEEAAVVTQAGVLALQALRLEQRVQPGQSVLVNGAGGGVGTFTVQTAKSLGAKVTGVDSHQKLTMIGSIGADQAIDYGREDFTRSGARYDHIVDTAAHHSLFECRRALSPEGTYVMVGGQTRRMAENLLLGPLLSMTSDQRMSVLFHEPDKDDLVTLAALVEANTVSPVIDSSYRLEDVPDALEHFGGGTVGGKVLITV